MKIPSDEVHVYSSESGRSNEEILRLEKLLSQDELDKAYRYKFEPDKNSYIIFRSLLRKLLGEYLSAEPSMIIFSYSEKGKPFLKDQNIKFNLSHSKGYAVYAFSSGKEVGIDVEYLREMPDALKIASRYFSDSEVGEFSKINEANIKEVFFRCWTRKEAFIKAVGEGLSYPLKDFSVTLKSGEPPLLTSIKENPEEINEWSLYDIDVKDNFISSLAVKSKGMRIVHIHPKRFN